MHDGAEMAAIVADIAAGDPRALQPLYERYAAQLFRYCWFRIGDVDATQDILQDVFVHVWYGLRSFDYRSEAALTAWLYRIASNVVINHVRKRNRRPSVSLEANADWLQLHGTDMAGTVCDRLALRQAIMRLSPDQQQVIALRYFGGLSNSDAAQVLGRTEGAIKSLHHRALLRLHQCLTAEAAAPVPLLPAAVLA